MSSRYSTLNTFSESYKENLKYSIDVVCDTLDNILSSVDIDVMKIDIEGEEYNALLGATNVLKQLRKIIIEIHGSDIDKIVNLLKENAFIIEKIKSQDMNYIIGSE